MQQCNATSGGISSIQSFVNQINDTDEMDKSAQLITGSGFGPSTLITVVMCAVLTMIIIAMECLNSEKCLQWLYCTECSEQRTILAPKPPGPKPFPIIGNLASMGGYEVPYQAFDALAEKYGSIISLRLGSVPTVVVNGIDNIKEVLITKTTHFDSRPNFRRYHDLFSGNKQNCK